MKGIFVIIVLASLIFIKCGENNNGIVDAEATIKSGETTWTLTWTDSSLGFNFNKGDWINRDKQNWSKNIDMVDFFIVHQQYLDDNNLMKNKHFIYGSPIATENSWVIPDSTKPSVKKLDETNIESVNEVPTTDYLLISDNIQLDCVYSIITQDNKYAIIQFVEIDLDRFRHYTFRWKYQANGSPKFK